MAPRLVLEANDICLILDSSGIIEQVAIGTDDASLASAEDWVGMAWSETATSESLNKIKDLLNGASSAGREGFQRLVGDVGLGKAGIVLGLEVSRLARNSSD